MEIVFCEVVVYCDPKINIYESNSFNSVNMELQFQINFEPGLIFEPLKVFSIERVSVSKTIWEHKFSRL